MRSLAATVLFFSVLSLPACGGGGGGGGDGGPQDPPKTLYVSEADGNDLHSGSSLAPMRSITAALAKGGPGFTILVAPGTYDAAGGESFPITLPADVTLVGDPAAKGDGAIATRILGAGPYDLVEATVVTGPGSTIQGFVIERPDWVPFGYYAVEIDGVEAFVKDCTFPHVDYAGVAVTSDKSPRIEDCVFRAFSYGVAAWNCTGGAKITGNLFETTQYAVSVSSAATNVEISSNQIVGGGYAGIQVQHGHPLIASNVFSCNGGYTYGAISVGSATALPTVTGNTFTGKGPIIDIVSGTPNVGDQVADGMNDFSAATGVVVKHEGTVVVDAIGNTWPHSPPTNGGDIVVTMPGTVVWGLGPTDVY